MDVWFKQVNLTKIFYSGNLFFKFDSYIIPFYSGFGLGRHISLYMLYTKIPVKQSRFARMQGPFSSVEIL